MKSLLLLVLVVLASTPVQAAKPCEELKAEIAARLEAAGVKNYVLEIVGNDKVGNAKVVGSCAGGSRKITYAKKPLG